MGEMSKIVGEDEQGNSLISFFVDIADRHVIKLLRSSDLLTSVHGVHCFQSRASFRKLSIRIKLGQYPSLFILYATSNCSISFQKRFIAKRNYLCLPM